MFGFKFGVGGKAGSAVFVDTGVVGGTGEFWEGDLLLVGNASMKA